MSLAEVKQLPDRNIQDIPRAMRTLADQIEAGELGNVRAIVWVVDVADAPVELGLMGACAEVAPTAHLLLGKGMRALEAG